MLKSENNVKIKINNKWLLYYYKYNLLIFLSSDIKKNYYSLIIKIWISVHLLTWLSEDTANFTLSAPANIFTIQKKNFCQNLNLNIVLKEMKKKN